MNNKVPNSDLMELIIKKLSGEASGSELKELDQLVSGNSEHQKLVTELSSIWEKSHVAEGITKTDVEREWNRLRNAIQEDERSQLGRRSWMRVAAVIVVLLSATIAVLTTSQNPTTEIIANELLVENMSDGSLITLKNTAKLTYSENYNENQRKVKLLGEAFFEVEKDPEKPFIVETENIQIEVLGTSFNVKTSTKSSEVVVTTGQVRISYSDSFVELERGEKGVFTSTGNKLFKLPNTDPNVDSWRTNKFIFDDRPLKEVIITLNNAFLSTLYVQDPLLEECPITASFENQSLDSILEILKATLSLEISETQNGLLISGEGC